MTTRSYKNIFKKYKQIVAFLELIPDIELYSSTIEKEQ